MRRPKPLVALFANLVLAHAMWVGTGRACSASNVSQSMGDVTATNKAAAMTSSVDMPGMESGANETASKTPSHQHTPCRIPWAPDGCQAATPCLPLAISSATQAIRTVDDTPIVIAPLHVLMPLSRGNAPEPPPPRA
jgi:hypothetical protein